ncbi:MAG: glycoside hydrolase family 97 catalytic domain-containing protein, partial [Sedimentisphaerales bacterium]|nr:glycoside hydrolase family 97 catalytic domain-containing protein [Sedimentisphaerales bacterium]
RRMQLTIRAYDEGIAFRYSFAQQESLKECVITDERAGFQFAGDYPAWAAYSAQGKYEKVPISRIKPNCERPLVVQIDNGPVVAIGEAGLVDFARMRLQPSDKYGVRPMLGSEVKVKTPYITPWRVVMIADTAGELIEHNYIFENLNAPYAISDTSWIKPGKVIREVMLTTEGGKACVDFAHKMNMQYVEFDAGWYGPENDDNADATTVTLDPKRSKGPLDLHEVIRYARDNGIGIWVYVNRRALEKQLDEILPLYKKWGIVGVKYGFVRVGDQQWTAWMHEAVRKAAANQLMVDIHDEYRPTGYSRTYPNLLTQEGIGGNEEMPPAEQNLVYPFTRYLCGAADYTICWTNNRVKNTLAHQLAGSMVYYSPLQFLFWYDRPSQVEDRPELEFFRQLPTVWDETKVIHGAIGEYITMARRSGQQWFIGSMNAIERRILYVPLSFLESGRTYTAHIYSDASPEGNDRTAVKVEKITVDSTAVISVDMARNGGQAIWLEPI